MSLRIFRISNIFSWSVAIFCGCLLFWVSQSVQTKEEEIRKLSHRNGLELEAIRVLEAEWDYLNSPVRLEELAKNHLRLDRMTPEKVMQDIASIPDPQENGEAAIAPAVLPIPVSTAPKAIPEAKPQLQPQQAARPAAANIIQNADRNSFSALLQDLSAEGGAE